MHIIIRLLVICLCVALAGCDDEPEAVAPAPEAATPQANEAPAGSDAKSPGVPGAPGVSIPPLLRRPALQAGDLHAAIKARNPSYTGTGQFVIEEGKLLAADLHDTAVTDLSPLSGHPIRELYLENTPVEDLSPLAGLPLNKLYLSSTKVSDLSPLRGSPLMELNLVSVPVRDLSPLAGLPLQMLWLNQVPVEDISPLAQTPLISLTLEGTNVRDISPLAEVPTLQRLHIGDTPVTDLTPLRNLPLTRLIFNPSQVTKGLMDVRRISTMQEIGTTLDGRQPPIQFWEAHDQGALK